MPSRTRGVGGGSAFSQATPASRVGGKNANCGEQWFLQTLRIEASLRPGLCQGCWESQAGARGSEPRDRCVLADPHPASQTLPRRTVLFGLIPRLCVSLLQESDRAMSPGVLSWWPRFNTPPAYEPGSGGQSKTTPAGSRRSRRAPGGPSRTGSSSSGGRKGRLPGLLAPDVGQRWSGNCGPSLLPRSLPKHAPPETVAGDGWCPTREPIQRKHEGGTPETGAKGSGRVGCTHCQSCLCGGGLQWTAGAGGHQRSSLGHCSLQQTHEGPRSHRLSLF